MSASVSGRRIRNVVPCPAFARDLDGSPEGLHVAQDDVHSHAAARELRDRGGRRDSRGEHEPDGVRLARLLPRHHALGPRPLDEEAAVDAGAVVGELDHDRARVVKSAEADRAPRVLAGGRAFRGRLDPVVDRVAHHVGEGIADLLDQAHVDLDLAAFDGEPDLLPELSGEVAHRAAELLERRADRDHPDARHEVLQVRLEPVRLAVDLERLLRVERAGVAEKLPEASARDRDLADEVEHPVQLLDVHAERPRRDVEVGDLARAILFPAHRVSERDVDRRAGSVRVARRAHPPEERVLGRAHLVEPSRRVREQLAQGVDGLKKERHEHGRRDEAAPAHPLEEVLEHVRELRERTEAESRRVSLERVRGAEDALQELVVVRVFLERDEALLHLREPLLGLRQEHAHQLAAVGVGDGRVGRLGRLHRFFTATSPVATENTTRRPRVPPTSLRTSGTPASSRKRVATATFWAPIGTRSTRARTAKRLRTSGP